MAMALKKALGKETTDRLWKAVKNSRERVQTAYKPLWDRSLAVYSGNYFFHAADPLFRVGHDIGDTDWVTVNWTAAGIQIKFCGDTAVPPRFTVSPRDGMSDPHVRPILSEFFNRRFNGASGNWTAAQAAKLDALVFGTGVVMNGWHEGAPAAVPVDAVSTREQDLHQEMLGGIADAFPDIEDAQDQIPSLEELYNVSGSGAVGFRVSTYDFIIPEEARWDTFQGARFCGRTYLQSRDRLEEAGYDLGGVRGMSEWQTDMGGFNLDPAVQDALMGPRMGGVEDTPRLVCMVEVYFREVRVAKDFTVDDDGVRRTYRKGIHNLKVLWAAERPDDPLDVTLWPYSIEDEYGEQQFPYTVLVNREVPGIFYGQGDVQIAEEQQRVLNITHSLTVDHLTKVKEKYMVQEGELSPEGIEALESMNTREVVQTKSHPSSGPIEPVPRSQVTFEFQQAMDQEREALNAVTGVSDAARGNAIPGAATATEAQLVNALSSGRSAKDAEKFEKFLCEIGEKWWAVFCQFNDRDQTVKVRMPEPDGSPASVSMRILGRELQVPVDITLTTGATRLQDQTQRLERKERFLAFAQGAMALAGGPINVLYLIQLYAEDAQVTDDFDALFSPPPPPPGMLPPGMAPPGAEPAGPGVLPGQAPPGGAAQPPGLPQIPGLAMAAQGAQGAQTSGPVAPIPLSPSTNGGPKNG